MRKLLPFILLFVLVVVLAACKNGGDAETTAPGAQTLFPGVSAAESTTAASDPAVQNVANTYVLTTTPDTPMPSVPTTQFNIANESVADPYTTQPLSTDINFTVPNMTAPVVNSSALPSTQPASTAHPTNNSATTTTKKPTTATTTTNPMVNAKPVRVELNDVSISGSKAIVTISGGSYKSNSTVISVKVNGETYNNIPCRISAGNLDGLGNQQVIIDLSGVSGFEEGAVVSGTIPNGFLRAKDNKTYNSAIPFTAS